jgi:hypothetical protein
MKTHLHLGKIVSLISAISLSIANRGFAEDKGTGGVTITKNDIIMHAGTKLSKDDEKALNDVLKKYDKTLYRVEKLQNGKLKKSIGELKIEGQVASELDKAKITGSTDSTVTFVTGSNPSVQAVRPDAQRLIQELKPIVEKYSKR